MTVGEAISIFKERLAGQQDIKEGAKVYRRKCLAALMKSWPELETTSIAKLSKDDCMAWTKDFSEKYSPSVYNNTVGTLHMFLDFGVEKGAKAQSPADSITKKRISQRELVLPSPEQFKQLLENIENAGAWCSKECADLVQFLAFGGFRKTQAGSDDPRCA